MSIHGRRPAFRWKPFAPVYQKKGAESFSSEDAQIVSFVREMIHDHRVSEPTFQAIYGRFGEKGMVELARDHRLLRHARLHAQYLRRLHVTPPDDLKICLSVAERSPCANSNPHCARVIAVDRAYRTVVSGKNRIQGKEFWQ